MSTVQDECSARRTVHHWTLHKLCSANQTTNEQACQVLGTARHRTAVSAGRLVVLNCVTGIHVCMNGITDIVPPIV